MMVSYTRARAEGLGIECKGGLMQRPERVVLLGVSALACGVVSAWLGGDYKIYVPGSSIQVFETMTIFTFPIAIMAVMTNITAVNRLREAGKALEAKEGHLFVNKAPDKKASVPFTLLLVALMFANLEAKAVVCPVPDSLSSSHFPTPSSIVNQLFYLQRTSNTNTVIYQLNVDGHGRLNTREPVRVFWLRYEEEGQPEELSFIQRRFAYGLKTRQVAPDRHELRFVSYSKFIFYLSKPNGIEQYRVYATISGRQAVLKRIYVHIEEGGSFWRPNVKYIELSGTDQVTGSELKEQIKV
jgi:hypothetical protein